MKLLNVKEAAKILDVSTVSVRAYITSGKLKASKKRKGLSFEYQIKETDLKIFQDEFMK